MTVMITGGMGAMGSATAHRLVEMGQTPVIFDMFEDYSLLADIKGKVIFQPGSVLDQGQLAGAIKDHGITRMAHTVALLTRADPKKALDVNINGTVNVLWAAHECKLKRLVYLSSKAAFSEVTGPHAHPEYKPIDESYPTESPLGIYGVTKRTGEQLGLEFHKTMGVDFIGLRFATTFGPGRLSKNPNSPMVVPCRIIEAAMAGKPFFYPHGGDQKDDYIYTKDVGRGIVCALFAENPAHRIFNVGTGKGSTLRDFVKAAQKLYPDFKGEIEGGLDNARIGFQFYSVYDISRAREELGFEPQYDLDKAVVDYVETMQHMGIEPTVIE